MKRLFWIFLTLAVIGLAGCKEMNDNPKPVKSIKIDIADLQNQMGINSLSGKSNASTSANPPSGVKTLLIGTLIVRSRSTPYTISLDYDDTTISEGLTDDLAQSIDYFKLVPLPTDSDEIEFDVPPQAAGNWQVVVVALATSPTVLSDLAESEHDGSERYYGFTSSFYTYDTLGDTTISIALSTTDSDLFN